MYWDLVRMSYDMVLYMDEPTNLTAYASVPEAVKFSTSPSGSTMPLTFLMPKSAMKLPLGKFSSTWSVMGFEGHSGARLT
jgi:hypothetical protein